MLHQLLDTAQIQRFPGMVNSGILRKSNKNVRDIAFDIGLIQMLY